MGKSFGCLSRIGQVGEVYKLHLVKSDEKVQSSGPGEFAGFFQFIHRKRPLLFLLGLFALVYVIIKIIAINFKALSVIEFAFIAILFGFAPAYFFRNVFKFENIIGWLTNSGALGILLIPFVFLVAGWLGINIVFAHSVSLLYLCSIGGIVSLLILADDKFVTEALTFRKLVKIDFFMIAILVGYTFILTIRNFSGVFSAWDAFTFWGLASKYIYQFQRLPDTTYDVFSYLKYSPFYPINFSIIYNMYDAIVEQYATWINVFINFLAIMLVYNRTLGKNILEKSLVVTLLIFASLTAIGSLYMLSMYADLLCAFMLLLYMLVLTNADNVEIHTFSKRAMLILLLTSSLFFIKSPFLILTLVLIATWIVYDYQFILQERKSLIKRSDLWSVFISIGLLYLMHFLYITYNLDFEDNMSYDKLILPVQTSLYTLFTYIKELSNYVINKNPYLLVLWIFALCLPFLSLKRKSVNRQFIFINVISFGIFFFYCFIYILNQRSLMSGSLIRYTSIILYLLPLMVTFAPIQISNRTILPVILVLLFIFSYSIRQTTKPINLSNIFRISTGSYSVALQKYSAFANKILGITGNDARILIVDEVNDLFTNMQNPAVYIRYFIMTNSVGGQYALFSKDHIIDRAIEYNADYILVLSYNDTFENCEDVFVHDHTYLIKLDRPIVNRTDECPFTEKAIVDFKNQGK